jgi:RND family efflux transporter MFP subunit
MPPEVSAIASARTTASQRVRLRLDPEIATQPLPPAQWPSQPLPAPERMAMPTLAPEPIRVPAIETEMPVEALEEEPVVEAMTFPVEEPSHSTAWELEAETAEEPPIQEEAMAHEIFETPVDPPAVVTTPAESVQPDSSWLQQTRRLIPPAALKVRSGGLPPISQSGAVRGNQPLSTRLGPRETKKEEAPLIVESIPAAAVTESRPLPRPELRRPSPLPLSSMTQPERSLGRGFWIVLLVVILLLAIVLYFFGAVPKITALLEQRNQPQPAVIVAAPVAPDRTVTYTVARGSMEPSVIPLSGTIEPFQQTALYARTTGYVRDWLADIGDPVKAGQVLAELDTPDVDHQLTQARASADEAKARLVLAQDEAKRWDMMAGAHAVSQQDADEKDSARDEAQAGFNAAQANVARLVDQELFKEIRAPYAGRVTARNLEVGTLVAAGSGSDNTELFRIAQTDPVRVFIDVPEASAPSIRAGLTASIEVPSFPGRVFNGTVVRDAGILDGKTHTLRTELSVANPDGALLPGAQAGVRLQLGDSAPVVLIPIDTLVAKPNGVAVARLTETNGHEVVHFTPVTVGRDFGTEVEVLDSVQAGDHIVSHPPADLQDGTAVNAQPVEENPMPSLLPPKPSAPRA